MSDEITNCVRLGLMLTDMAGELLPKVFKYLTKTEDIVGVLSSEKQQKILKELSKKNVIKKSEYLLVRGQDIKLERIDCSLWIKLILNLCKDNIREPQCGWKTKPNPMDESLGADLLRIKDARNKIIAHRPGTKLSKGEYDVKWAKMTDILLRVVKRVDSGSSDVFVGKINDYKELHVSQVKKLQDKRQQEKFEELMRRSQELQRYLSAGLERLTRYGKLLLTGGRIVLCRELTRKLGDQDLWNFLEGKKEMLTGNVEEKYYSSLNSQASCSDYENWDVDLLASVLLGVCNDDLTQEAIIHIKRIQSIRADLNSSAPALQSLDPDDFLTIWTDLLMCLIDFYKSISEEDQRQVENLIELYKKKDKGRCDVEEYIKQLRELGVKFNVNKEIMTELKDVLKLFSQENIKFKQEHAVKIKLLANCDNEETRKIAKGFLKECMENSAHTSEDPQCPLQQEIVKLLDILSALPDVTPVRENRKRKNQSQVNNPIKRSCDTNTIKPNNNFDGD